MRQSSVYTSAALHMILLLLAIVGLPWIKRDFVIPPPISIELAELAPITQTTKVAPKATPKPEEPPKQEPPPPQPDNKASEVKPPVPEEKKEEKAEEKEKEKPKPTDEALPDKKKKEEEKKKKQEKKEEKKAEEKPKDFASVLKNLAEPKPAAPAPVDTPDMKVNDAAAPEQAANAPLGPKMTMSEEDALRRQLEGCWNVPFGAKDAESTIVEIFMVINPDRTLREARIVDTARYNSDNFYRAMADSALRAVRNPLCSPFQLPPDKYDTWKTTTVVFNPSQMF